jgi:NAD-dependent SIR2 family protein deacetylase
LIQAQFDAAARQAPCSSPQSESDKSEQSEDAPPPKRRRISPDTSQIHSDSTDEAEPVGEVIEVCEPGVIVVRSANDADQDETAPQESSPRAPQNGDSNTTSGPSTPHSKKRPHPLSISVLPTSPLSSPPRAAATPEPLRGFDSTRLVGAAIPSSPLSSPPAIIFEPSIPSSPSDDSSEDQSSTPPSEVEEVPPASNPFASSQASNGGRTLPNMKGKDLFDVGIWSDPLRTSVFYTFATTLRQKIKDIQPTSSHKFISHLRDRGKLVRCYTQNIDQIEEKVGLSTSLTDGPGARGRFSRRSTANTAQLSKMVEEASSTPDTPADPAVETCDSSQVALEQQSQDEVDAKPEEEQPADQSKVSAPLKREPSKSGVECVFLHGSLEQLRCFLCGRVCSWDDADREVETLSGQQPECPHCAGATAARQERGKRALGVGKLRPDIVLYGEEHPNAHLISPIVTHDLGLQPDMLLILGTSLRVHGLKVMVREFAKAVHSRGGKVVFVNFTKPPESSWGDIIDYWVEWDCDAWVSNLQERVPKLWQDPETIKPRKPRASGGASDDNDKPDVKKPPAAYPVALRDTKAVGAYWTLKIVEDLHKMTGTPLQQVAGLVPEPSSTPKMEFPKTEVVIEVATQLPSPEADKDKGKPKARRPRKSALGAAEKPKKPLSTLNPSHGRTRRKKAEPTTPEAVPDDTGSLPVPTEQPEEGNSILDSVKGNARVRKPRRMFGGEEPSAKPGKKRGNTIVAAGTTSPSAAAGNDKPGKPDLSLQLAPFSPQPPSGYKIDPIEPKSPPAGPQTQIPPKPRGPSWVSGIQTTFQIVQMLAGITQSPSRALASSSSRVSTRSRAQPLQPVGRVAARPAMPLTPTRDAEEDAALALEGLRNSSPAMMPTPTQQEERKRFGWRRW